MSLAVLFGVEEDDHGRHEVDHLAGRQQVQVGAGVFAAIAVHPFQFRFLCQKKYNKLFLDLKCTYYRNKQYLRDCITLIL